MDLDTMKELLAKGTELVDKIPNPQQLMDGIGQILLVLMLAGPVVMVVMGLLYSFAAPKEANHHFGFRCYYGMGSVEAWRFTQRLAGVVWIALGVILLAAMLVLAMRLKTAEVDTMTLLLSALAGVLVQAAVLVLASLLIRITVFVRFDRHGNSRFKRRRFARH